MNQKLPTSPSLCPDPTRTSPLPVDGVGGLVIGGDYQGLGITRSLGRFNVPVCVVDDERSIARYSRYATQAVRVENLRDEETTVTTLLEIGRRRKLKGWVLYPTRDETVAAFSRHRLRLSEWFRVPTPGWETVKWAWDKRKTYRMAEKLGIRIPRTWFPQSIADVQQIDATFPVILKPAIKEHFIYATKAKGWVANSREELRDLFLKAAALIPADEIMIQDLIPGGSAQQYGYSAFFKERGPVATMVTHNKRSHPPKLGRSSTFVETVNLPLLEGIAEHFLRAIDYYGLVEVEFRLDPRDGQYKLLDVNARTWGYHSIGAVAGVDFCRLLFEDQLGRPVTPSRARPGVTWVRVMTDLPVGILGALRGQWGYWSYLKSIIRCSTEAVFCARDPLPTLVETALIPYLFYKRGY
jgi:D-aspartate ligase